MNEPLSVPAIEAISQDAIRSHIEALEGIRHPQASPAALEAAADYVHGALQRLGYDMDEHIFAEGSNQYRNIIGTRWGLERPDNRLLVVAHFDTVAESPGADDNASAVAVLLEIARALSRVKLQSTVQFVGVNLEERGPQGAEETSITRGSHALATHAREQGWRIDGVIVLECVAYAGARLPQKLPQGLPIEAPEHGDFIAAVGNEASSALVEAFVQAIDRYAVPLPCLPLIVPGRGEALPDVRRSDHAPFWDVGYPAMMLTDTANFRNPHYHQPTDTLETLNLEFAAAVCRATAGLVLSLAGASA